MTKRPWAVAVAILFLFPAAQAAADGSLASAILNCSALPDDQAQLACFRQIADQLKAGSVAAVAPQTGAQPQTQAEAPSAGRQGSVWYDVGSWFGGSEAPKPTRRVIGTPAEFGKESMLPESNDPVPLDHITAGVVKVTQNFFGRFTVTLDNGQVWRQNESDTAAARFPSDGKVTVTIHRGFLDAFYLSIDGLWGSYQVKRLK